MQQGDKWLLFSGAAGGMDGWKGWREGGEGEAVGHSGCCHDDSGEREPMAAPPLQPAS